MSTKELMGPSLLSGSSSKYVAVVGDSMPSEPAQYTRGTQSNSFLIGDGNDTDKSIIANTGDADLPTIKYNPTLDLWQYSDDGVHFTSLAGDKVLSYLESVTTIQLDWSLAKTMELTLTKDLGITFTNMINGVTYQLAIIQDSQGSRLISSWPTIKWSGGSAPTLTTAGSKADLVSLTKLSSGIYGSVKQNF